MEYMTLLDHIRAHQSRGHVEADIAADMELILLGEPRATVRVYDHPDAEAYLTYDEDEGRWADEEHTVTGLDGREVDIRDIAVYGDEGGADRYDARAGGESGPQWHKPSAEDADAAPNKGVNAR